MTKTMLKTRHQERMRIRTKRQEIMPTMMRRVLKMIYSEVFKVEVEIDIAAR